MNGWRAQSSSFKTRSSEPLNNSNFPYRQKSSAFMPEIFKLIFAENAWDDYLSWQTEDKKILQRINMLIKEIQRQPFSGIGDPEPLKHNWKGYWSRRITREHRLVYKIAGDELWIAQCRYHY